MCYAAPYLYVTILKRVSTTNILQSEVVFQNMGSLALPKPYLACQISYSCAVFVFWQHTSTLFLSESIFKSVCQKTSFPTNWATGMLVSKFGLEY